MSAVRALAVGLAVVSGSVIWFAGARAQTPRSPFQPWNNTGIRGLVPGQTGPLDAETTFPPIPPAVATLAGPEGPAPLHDLTGIWDAGRAGIQPFGARNPPPLTPWGEATGKTHKSGNGIRMVDVTEINDPLSTLGDPAGYPRQLLYELRPVQFVHTGDSVIALFMWERRWRTIWTDGRSLPADPDPRWYGYSVGAWENDSTFVVRSNGTDERTWLDNGGNPHSDQLRVEERWQRLSRNRLELTVTIDDPKTYVRPWVAVDRLPFVQLPPDTDLIEMMNSASDVQATATQYKREPPAK